MSVSEIAHVTWLGHSSPFSGGDKREQLYLHLAARVPLKTNRRVCEEKMPFRRVGALQLIVEKNWMPS